MKRCYADSFLQCYKDPFSHYWAAADAFGLAPPVIMKLVYRHLTSEKMRNSRIGAGRHLEFAANVVKETLDLWNRCRKPTDSDFTMTMISEISIVWSCLAQIFGVNICIIKLGRRDLLMKEAIHLKLLDARPPSGYYPVLDRSFCCFFYERGFYNLLARRHDCVLFSRALISPFEENVLPDCVWPLQNPDLKEVTLKCLLGS